MDLKNNSDKRQEIKTETFSKFSSNDIEAFLQKLADLGYSARFASFWLGRVLIIVDSFWSKGWGKSSSGAGRPRILTRDIGALFEVKERQGRNVLQVLRGLGICHRVGRRLVFDFIPGDRRLKRARRADKVKEAGKKKKPRKKNGRRSQKDAKKHEDRTLRRVRERKEVTEEHIRKEKLLDQVLSDLDPRLVSLAEKKRGKVDAERLAAALTHLNDKLAGGWTPEKSLGGYLHGTLKHLDEHGIEEALKEWRRARKNKEQAQAKRDVQIAETLRFSEERRAWLKGAAKLSGQDALYIAEEVTKAKAKASTPGISPDNPLQKERLRKTCDEAIIRAMRRLFPTGPPDN